jgi:hypothetical protein
MSEKIPQDATVADPPSSESAASEHPRRTPGLGNALADLPKAAGTDPSTVKTVSPNPQEQR